jgi:hypothetical protein
VKYEEVSVQKVSNGYIVSAFIAKEESNETGRRVVRDHQHMVFGDLEKVTLFLDAHFREERWNLPDKT